MSTSERASECCSKLCILKGSSRALQGRPGQYNLGHNHNHNHNQQQKERQQQQQQQRRCGNQSRVEWSVKYLHERRNPCGGSPSLSPSRRCWSNATRVEVCLCCQLCP